jgi:hypothetical protein
MADQVGLPIVQGIAQGITDNVKLIIQAFKDAADQVVSKGVKDFANKVKAVADAIIKVSEAVGIVGNLIVPANFESKMKGLDWMIVVMVSMVAKAAKLFDEGTLKLVQLYADATKKVASAIIEIGEMFEVIAEIKWPKGGMWEAIWKGLDWLIFIMMITIRKTALRFDAPTLKLIDTYAKTVKKVSGAVIEFGEALDIIANLKWPKAKTWQRIFSGLNWLMLVMVNTIKSSARLFDAATLALIDIYAKAVRGVSDTLSTIVEDVTVAIGHIETLVNKNVPGSLKNVTVQMLMILHNLTTPMRSVGVAVGTAFVGGIISAIEAGMVGVSGAMTNMIGNVQLDQPQFETATPSSGTPSIGLLSARGNSRSVVVEAGAFPVTINDSMDAEEFKFNTLEILRQLTE